MVEKSKNCPLFLYSSTDVWKLWPNYVKENQLHIFLLFFSVMLLNLYYVINLNTLGAYKTVNLFVLITISLRQTTDCTLAKQTIQINKKAWQTEMSHYPEVLDAAVPQACTMKPDLLANQVGFSLLVCTNPGL